MKTPMQELIEKITLKTRGGITFLLPSISNSNIEELLEKEKDAIMGAHFAPRYGCFSENYYNERYNTKENG